MKLRPIYNSWLPRLLKVEAITLYPFIFFANYRAYYSFNFMEKIFRHEYQHVLQIREVGPIFFYLDYVRQWIMNLIREKDSFRAYWLIDYEIEAREVELVPVHAIHDEEFTRTFFPDGERNLYTPEAED